MIVEVTRLIHRWLEHPIEGVAFKLPDVPREKPEGGTDALPATPTIYDDVDTDELAGDFLDPPSSPALVVYVDNTITVPVHHAKFYQRGERPALVIVAYCTQDMAGVDAVRGGNYTLRAVKRCLTRFNDQKASAGYREVNGVKVAALLDVTEVGVRGAVGKSKLWGFAQATAVVIDTLP